MSNVPWFRDRQLGSADTTNERDQQILRARLLEGLTLLAVRYFTLDYKHMDRPSADAGPRVVTDPSEYAGSMWRYESFDSVDFYIELVADRGQIFTIGWDPPSNREGLWLHAGSTGGEPFASTSPVAMWDASESSHWAPSVGSVVDTVEPRYRPWGQSAGYWCDLVTLTVAGRKVTTFLGDVGQGEAMVPSANNLLTVTDPASLPGWLAD